MGLFGKNKNKTVDLTESMVRKKERLDTTKENLSPGSVSPQVSAGSSSSTSPDSSGFGFLSNLASAGFSGSSDTSTGSGYPGYVNQSPAGSYSDSAADSEEEKRRKLAKRLIDITNRLEDLSTQIYHLQQRVELLEKKSEKTGF